MKLNDIRNVGFTKKDMGDAEDVTVAQLTRDLVRSMFMNNAISSILQVTLKGTGQNDPPPIVEIELRLRSINGQVIKLEETTDGD